MRNHKNNTTVYFEYDEQKDGCLPALVSVLAGLAALAGAMIWMVA
jgi:hypothetical protein